MHFKPSALDDPMASSCERQHSAKATVQTGRRPPSMSAIMFDQGTTLNRLCRTALVSSGRRFGMSEIPVSEIDSMSVYRSDRRHLAARRTKQLLGKT